MVQRDDGHSIVGERGPRTVHLDLVDGRAQGMALGGRLLEGQPPPAEAHERHVRIRVRGQLVYADELPVDVEEVAGPDAGPRHEPHAVAHGIVVAQVDRGLPYRTQRGAGHRVAPRVEHLQHGVERRAEPGGHDGEDEGLAARGAEAEDVLVTPGGALDASVYGERRRNRLRVREVVRLALLRLGVVPYHDVDRVERLT